MTSPARVAADIAALLPSTDPLGQLARQRLAVAVRHQETALTERLTGPQDAPEGMRATSTDPDKGAAAASGSGTAAAAAYSPIEAPVARKSAGRTETYQVEGPDGRLATVTRDLDTGEQTTTYPDGGTYELAPLAETVHPDIPPTRVAG